MSEYVIALDQGTTSSRSIIFDRNAGIVSLAQQPFEQIFPQPGWVEHDPMSILRTQLETLKRAFETAGIKASEIAGIGITNQRETTVVWNRHTGKPVYNAIVWQCRRTAEFCDDLSASGAGPQISEITGLLPDAYFSGSKIRWILDNVPGARADAENGNLLFGTIDSWLIWNLTGGRVHVSDCSNAARTMLFDIRSLKWDDSLCSLLNVPKSMLPEPVSNSAVYGYVDGRYCGIPELDGVPVCGSAGDQQAALFGQACFSKGEAKNTYGTGCFTLMNTGSDIIRSTNGLLTTVAWNLNGKTTYTLEGSVFNGGSTIQWLRDQLGIISSAAECDKLAANVPDSGGVFLVPAFTGLGAPYWDPYARAMIIGLTRGSNKSHIARAALEGIAFQVNDLLSAMQADAGAPLPVLRVDGGACVSDIMMQFQADLLRAPVDRPVVTETTALGAAYLAGLGSGLWKDTDELTVHRKTDRIFKPERPEYEADAHVKQWRRAVERACEWEK